MSPLPQRKTPTVEDLTGIRVRGLPELNEKDRRMRQKPELSQFQKITAQVDVETEIGDIVRLGKYDENKRRTILLLWQVFGTDGFFYHRHEKMKTFEHSVFLRVNNYPTKSNKKVKRKKILRTTHF